MSEKNKKMTFEEAMAELEAAVDALENGKLTLEESLAEFERAVGLVKQCRKDLDRAEKRVSVLLKNEEGAPTGESVPFIPETDGDAGRS